MDFGTAVRDHLAQRREPAVVHVWCAHRHVAQRRRLEPAVAGALVAGARRVEPYVSRRQADMRVGDVTADAAGRARAFSGYGDEEPVPETLGLGETRGERW